MTWCGVVVWAAMMAIAAYCVRAPRTVDSNRARNLLIIGGGVVFPTVALAMLLMFAIPPIGTLADRAQPGNLTVVVSGEQWWWRIQYRRASGQVVDLANQLHLPVGQRVDIRLTSSNVIHSFWIPSISGKVDMIPGRITHLSLEPSRVGTFGGVCAEYCGTSHALMAFDVTVMEPAAFEQWLDNQALPAAAVAAPAAIIGSERFIASGCGACHTIRGTSAAGTVGPDLTHVGSRLRLGAGTLPNSAEHLAEWITSPDRVKPHARMPAFETLGDDVQAIAAYLHELR